MNGTDIGRDTGHRAVSAGHPPQQLSVEAEGRGDHEARHPHQPRHKQAASATVDTLDTSYGLLGENSNWFKVDYGDRQKPFLVTAFTAFIFEMNEMDFSFMRLTVSSFSTLLNFHFNLSLAVTGDCG